jgi:hypothetical protein
MSAATDLQASTQGQHVKKRYNYRVKTGRPPAYKKVYCDMLVDFCAKGYSLTAFAGSIRVARSCLLRWAEQYPEFKSAIEIAKAARTTGLECELLAEDSGPRINARIFALKNAAPEEWADKQNIEINQTVNVAVTLAQALDSLSTKVIEGTLHTDDATPVNAINEMRAEQTAIEAIEARDAVADKAEAEAPLPGSILDPSMSK